MPDRSMTNTVLLDGDHRFGFNGKEQDNSNEWGRLTHYDYGFRIYKPGIAKFLSVDPLTKDYPMLTPYQFASNTPVWAIDMDGLEAVTLQQMQELFIHKRDKTSLEVLNSETKPIVNLQTNEVHGISYSTWTTKSGDLTINGQTHEAVSTGKSLTFTHSFNGKTISTNFNVSGVSTSLFNAPKLHVGTLFHLRGISRHLASSKDPVSGLSRPTILDQFDSTLTGRGVSNNSKEFSKDAFRHISFSAIMTFLYDENTAKIIGDAHERDNTGLLGSFYDSTIDIINNEYGRILGSELKDGDFKGADLSDPSMLAKFLNSVAKNVTNAFPDIGSNTIFSSEQESVQNLAKEIK